VFWGKKKKRGRKLRKGMLEMQSILRPKGEGMRTETYPLLAGKRSGGAEKGGRGGGIAEFTPGRDSYQEERKRQS